MESHGTAGVSSVAGGHRAPGSGALLSQRSCYGEASPGQHPGWGGGAHPHCSICADYKVRGLLVTEHKQLAAPDRGEGVVATKPAAAGGVNSDWRIGHKGVVSARQVQAVSRTQPAARLVHADELPESPTARGGTHGRGGSSPRSGAWHARASRLLQAPGLVKSGRNFDSPPAADVGGSAEHSIGRTQPAVADPALSVSDPESGSAWSLLAAAAEQQNNPQPDEQKGLIPDSSAGVYMPGTQLPFLLQNSLLWAAGRPSCGVARSQSSIEDEQLSQLVHLRGPYLSCSLEPAAAYSLQHLPQQRLPRRNHNVSQLPAPSLRVQLAGVQTHRMGSPLP